ncbi:hypothetical protein [Streptomyces sp. CBMA156]|nr:hypothetical protein [Streptomyces sp. CBMA156]
MTERDEKRDESAERHVTAEPHVTAGRADGAAGALAEPCPHGAAGL